MVRTRGGQILKTLGAGAATYLLVVACSQSSDSSSPSGTGGSMMDPVMNLIDDMREPVSPVDAHQGGASGSDACACDSAEPAIIEVRYEGSGAHAQFDLPGATLADMTTLKVVGGASYIGPNGYSSLPALGVQEGSIVWDCDINGFAKVIVPGRLAHLIPD